MYKLIFTCEHGGNEVPKEFQSHFQISEKVLDSHLAWDIGALNVARYLAAHLDDDFYYATSTRLLIDLNRSLHDRHLFSIITKKWSSTWKAMLINQVYKPYRDPIELKIKEWLMYGHQVLHFSIHSFTPLFNNQERAADVGLLYDPSRAKEKLICAAIKVKLEQGALKVRRNFPYLGKSDGFVTYLRKKLASENYIGIEIEMNQGRLVIQESDERIKTLLLNNRHDYNDHEQKILRLICLAAALGFSTQKNLNYLNFDNAMLLCGITFELGGQLAEYLNIPQYIATTTSSIFNTPEQIFNVPENVANLTEQFMDYCQEMLSDELDESAPYMGVIG